MVCGEADFSGWEEMLRGGETPDFLSVTPVISVVESKGLNHRGHGGHGGRLP